MADVVETSSTGSFTIKRIEVKVSLRDGEFEGGGNTKIITDVPIHVKIEKTGPPDFCKASVEARGLKYEDMDCLTTLAFKPLKAAKNVVSIMVGNEVDGMSLAFQGEIESASADFNNAPNITLKLDCKAGYYGQTTPKGPTAVKGNQTCSSFVAMLAKEMGYTYSDEGVTIQLSNSIFNGSPVQQARAAARQVGAELLIDDGVMTLTPSGGNGDTTRAVLLNKESGMLKYPVITQDGIDVKALYNPEFKLGGYIRVESIVPGATGLWRIAKLSHDLAAFDPSGGPWESQISATDPASSGKNGSDKKKK